MILSPLRVSSGSRAALEIHRERLVVVLCERKSSVAIPVGMHALWCPVFGETNIVAPMWENRLSRADIYVGDAQVPYEGHVSARGACIVVAGSAQAWSALVRTSGDAKPGAVPFPATYRRRVSMCLRYLRIVRRCFGAVVTPGQQTLPRDLMQLIDEMQSEFADPIARCPGSSLARKRAVFVRLQRVRNHIAACAHEDLDITKLALVANYSVGHFITIFRSVFGETPYSSISRHRVDSARAMLSASQLGVGEIAQSSGFPSQSSFTRAIKRHLGLSATEFRAARNHDRRVARKGVQ
jgi:AraC family transcriptional regulator